MLSTRSKFLAHTECIAANKVDRFIAVRDRCHSPSNSPVLAHARYESYTQRDSWLVIPRR